MIEQDLAAGIANEPGNVHRFLYVTQSKPLTASMQSAMQELLAMLKQEIENEHGEGVKINWNRYQVDFVTPEELYKKAYPAAAGATLIGEKEFIDWFVTRRTAKVGEYKKDKKDAIKEEAEAAYHYYEFRTMSGYKDFAAYDQAVSERYSFFAKESAQRFGSYMKSIVNILRALPRSLIWLLQRWMQRCLASKPKV